MNKDRRVKVRSENDTRVTKIAKYRVVAAESRFQKSAVNRIFDGLFLTFIMIVRYRRTPYCDNTLQEIMPQKVKETTVIQLLFSKSYLNSSIRKLWK